MSDTATISNVQERLKPIPSRIQVIKLLAAGETLDVSLRDGLKILNCRLPNEWISSRPSYSQGKKGTDIFYLNRTDISLILDFVFDYQWSIDYEVNQTDKYVVIKATLKVVGNDDKEKTVSELGYANLEEQDNYGGPVLEATAQSFRRSAALLGLGRYLYFPQLIPPQI